MCLSGDTPINHYYQEGVTAKTTTIKELAEAFENKGRGAAGKRYSLIRTVNDDGTIEKTKIKYCWKTGVKPVFRVTEDSIIGRSIVVTDNHPFKTPNGYKKLSELKVGDEIYINGIHDTITELWNKGIRTQEIAEQVGITTSKVYNIVYKLNLHRRGKKGEVRKKYYKQSGEHSDPRAIARRILSIDKDSICEVCGSPGEEIHHIDKNPYNNSLDNLVLLCRKHHREMHNSKYLCNSVYIRKIKSIEYVGEEDVYDLEVDNDNHNFVANGFVVHNCEFTFILKIPIFVMRQHIRHRTACLSGDTILEFDLPHHIKNGIYKRFPIKLKDLYERWEYGCFGNIRNEIDLSFINDDDFYTANEIGSWFINRKNKCNLQTFYLKAKNNKMCSHYKGEDIKNYYQWCKKNEFNIHKENTQKMNLRSLNENDKELYYTHISNIWKSGVKKVYEIKTEDKEIKASEDHLFFTMNGWKKLKDIEIGEKIWCLCSTDTEERGYLEPNWGTHQDNSNDMKEHGHQTIIKGRLRTVISKKFIKEEMTYDVSVVGPFHNFSANGFVVHNSVNEYSGRYSIMKNEMYLPELNRLKGQSQSNKQMSAGLLNEYDGRDILCLMEDVYDLAYENYQSAMSMGLARETARIQLPLSTYTELYWKIDLKNLFHYIRLREDKDHAQWEIVELARIIGDLIQPYVPMAYQAFLDYEKNSMTFSSIELGLLKNLLNYAYLIETPEQEDVKRIVKKRNPQAEETMNKKEFQEFITKITKIITN